MEFFFADDSKQKSSREGMGNILGFGGIFANKEILGELERQVKAICDEYAIPHEEEIKWSPNRGSWIRENLHGMHRVSCYSRILSAAKGLGCRALVVAWDEGRTTLKGERAFDKILDFAFERITMHLSKIGKLGVIIADRPGGGARDDAHFLSNFLTRVQKGTVHVRPERVPINILTTPSHLQVHLQIADLVTAITCAMVAGQNQYASEYFPIVKDMLIENAYGYKGGAGLKIFPDNLVNLYFHVLGETEFSKVAMSIGWGLPDKSLPYADL
jgi:hypothetical protein